MQRLAGKVALVTGGARGIGEGIVRRFIAEGAQVIISDVLVSEGEALAHELGSNAAFIRQDVADRAGWDTAIATVEAKFGKLDILVNNAFTLSDDLIEPKPFWEKPLSNLEMWQVGVRSSFVAAWHAAPLMVPQKSGLIVAISGFVGVTYTFGVVFGTAKTAVDRMARDMAIELKPHNIASLSLWQGLTLTEKAHYNLAQSKEKMTSSITSMTGSSVEHPGRVIAALAADPDIMARSGGTFITTEVAQDYGITDIDGRVIPSARDSRGGPIWQPI